MQAAVMDNDSLSHQQLEELARECLLPVSEVEMFADHLYAINKGRKAVASKKHEKAAAEENRKGEY